MYIKRLKECEEFTAGDDCLLRELLNPIKEDVSINYSMAHAHVKPNSRTRAHVLTASEVYYILSGEGEMNINDEKESVSAGHAVYIPPNAKQFIVNKGQNDLVFLCIVAPPWKPEVEQIL